MAEMEVLIEEAENREPCLRQTLMDAVLEACEHP